MTGKQRQIDLIVNVVVFRDGSVSVFSPDTRDDAWRKALFQGIADSYADRAAGAAEIPTP